MMLTDKFLVIRCGHVSTNNALLTCNPSSDGLTLSLLSNPLAYVAGLAINFSALEMSCDNALYKSILHYITLHYITLSTVCQWFIRYYPTVGSYCVLLLLLLLL